MSDDWEAREAQAIGVARESLSADDPTGWFDRLYQAAEQSNTPVPWDSEAPQVLLAEALRGRDGAGKSALVVGCGLGRDAEFISTLGFSVTAFDISPTAIAGAKRRHAQTTVTYTTADLLDPPSGWTRTFDLVAESYTVQALPDPPRPQAIQAISRFVAPRGQLLVIAVARDPDQPTDGPPWLLLKTEIEAFAADGLTIDSIERIHDEENPSHTRWRALFTRPGA